jgi:hypothetical protein
MWGEEVHADTFMDLGVAVQICLPAASAATLADWLLGLFVSGVSSLLTWHGGNNRNMHLSTPYIS